MAVPHRKRNRTENTNKIRKKSLLAEKVADYSIRSGDVESIIRSMSSSGGFESRNLATGINILRTMRDDSRCTRFLSFVGSNCLDRGSGNNTGHVKEQHVSMCDNYMRCP